MKIDTTWLLFGVVAGGMGVALIAGGLLVIASPYFIGG